MNMKVLLFLTRFRKFTDRGGRGRGGGRRPGAQFYAVAGGGKKSRTAQTSSGHPSLRPQGYRALSEKREKERGGGKVKEEKRENFTVFGAFRHGKKEKVALDDFF